MSLTFELQREGELISRPNGQGDGMVDVWGASGYPAGTSKQSIRNGLVAELIDQGWATEKEGVPLSAIRVRPISTVLAQCRVIYGRAGGNGGYFLPPSYSGMSAEDGWVQIPVCRNEAQGFPKYTFQTVRVRRPTTRLLFNTRIEQGDVVLRRATIRRNTNRIIMIDGAWFVCKGGRVYRAPNNERRAEVVFETTAGIPRYEPGDLAGNVTAIDELKELGEYVVNSDVTPPHVTTEPPERIYPEVETDAFDWINFDE